MPAPLLDNSSEHRLARFIPRLCAMSLTCKGPLHYPSYDPTMTRSGTTYRVDITTEKGVSASRRSSGSALLSPGGDRDREVVSRGSCLLRANPRPRSRG